MARRSDPFDVEITPELIVRAYRAGIFPMSESAGATDVFWVSPEQRGIIPLDRFIASASLRKAIRKTPFRIKIDTDFEAVIEGCASVGEDRHETWINATIRSVYGDLFRRGIAHTVEVWDGAQLVGGLYGLAIGGAFFGESMFHRRTNASKIALAHLVDRLKTGGFSLLDTQFMTDHLASLGGIEIPRADYEEMLATALEHQGNWRAWEQTGR